jgi:hypothetical protein
MAIYVWLDNCTGVLYHWYNSENEETSDIWHSMDKSQWWSVEYAKFNSQ